MWLRYVSGKREFVISSGTYQPDATLLELTDDDNTFEVVRCLDAVAEIAPDPDEEDFEGWQPEGFGIRG